MTSSTAPLLTALRAGEPQLMLGIRMSRSTDIVRIAKSTGYHCVLIDLEHSAMTVETAVALAACAGDIGLTALVRVPEREYGVIGRLLDGGAHGIIAPRVETASEARSIVDACRFPPRGHRSQLTQMPQRGMVPIAARELNPLVDAATIVKILIETPAGASNAQEIAAVDGVDIIGLGANDFTSELGIPGDYEDPRVAAAVSAVAAAGRAHDKPAMVGGVPLGSTLERFFALGMAPLFLAGVDSDLMHRAAADRSAATREWYADRRGR
ncbi:HpcH/HpaI aldolase family protein [Microbacterium deminutum]|uniref:Aldolase/citrate lyase family protein n=1 Tax=Microbacterium deminutum TaxID=344164 RepID=A0ABP5BGW8_9MICO